MIGTFFLSDNIIKIMFGNDFLPAIITMRILSPLIVILSIGNLFGTQILMTMGEEKKLLISVTVGAIVNFVLNYNIIPRMQQNGAALSSVIAEFIVMLIQVILAIKYIKIEINYRFVLNIIISNIIMTILLLIISYFIKSLLLNLILSVIIGGTIYVVTNILLKEKIIIDIVDEIIKKIIVRK